MYFLRIKAQKFETNVENLGFKINLNFKIVVKSRKNSRF